MSTRMAPRMIQVTFRYLDGSVRLAAPADVPLGELMPDFLDLAEQPDGDGWVLGADRAHAYPGERTLAELGVLDGGVLVLHRAPDGPATTGEDASSSPAPPPPGPRSGGQERPLRERTARTLPPKLSRPERSRLALRALASDRARHKAPEPAQSSVPGPRTFTRPARPSPMRRVREAWRSTDYQHQLDELILASRLQRCATIGVISPKGGVGKTTTAALLGSLLAFLRRDRVVAVETNPDWGSLGRRLAPDHPVFIDDLLAGPLLDQRLSPTQLDAQLARGPDGLMVAPAPTDPERAKKLDETAYLTLFAHLSELVGTLILDCGTGLDDPPARAALATADQLVLVCDDEPDTASIVSEAAEWLRRIVEPTGAQQKSLVVVVNNLRRSSRIDVAALERATAYAHGLAVIPRHERAAARLHGSRFTWNHAPAGWQTPVRELAALLASDWPRLQIAH
jgi:MinD-like ATPase involved in chromosome partitioning or flagellar assembly